MKRILVDVDSVVIDLMPTWLSYYNDDYHDQLTVNQITEWDMCKFVKPECGDKIYDYLHDASLYDSVRPIDGAISSIHWLRQHSYDVRFVTSGVQPAKIEWLGNHGLLLDSNFLFSRDVVVAHDKSIINGDILIDDNSENCSSFSGSSILFAQPWNAQDIKDYYYRADSWPDVIQYLARKHSS
jgi:5'(3')-deoxyribonucleotidase